MKIQTTLSLALNVGDEHDRATLLDGEASTIIRSGIGEAFKGMLSPDGLNIESLRVHDSDEDARPLNFCPCCSIGFLVQVQRRFGYNALDEYGKPTDILLKTTDDGTESAVIGLECMNCGKRWPRLNSNEHGEATARASF